MVPVPLISTSLRPEPLMKGVLALGHLGMTIRPLVVALRGSIWSIAPASICRLMLLARVIGPLRYVLNVPLAGISTVPPPAVAAALMVFWIAVALFVRPSPSAPNAVTMKLVVGMTGKGGVPAWDGDTHIGKTNASAVQTNL